MTRDDSRPNPDALLAEVQAHESKSNRGRLKVFFGMAAGVGKTYAMLEEARKRAAEGADVLVGYAEPHIRTDTEALLLGMELLPYKIVEYRGAKLKEFDLETALKRKPAIILVDELAHSNAPGMRHPKRWQDVVEMLNAGINVYTTLNVQHLESVNDIVERVSGVKVQETLPDRVLEEADEVELVDIAPEELLERFREGKVYRPEQAERAAKHFFTKGNLIALRELALRTTAQRVDMQMQEARREAGIRATWASSERLLVCISPSPMSRRLVRTAKRLATSLKADWIAAYVEIPRGRELTPRDRLRLDGTLRLAEQLGAKPITLSGNNVADEIIAYSQAHNVTKVVVGKPEQPRWREWLQGSIVDDLIRRSGEIDIYVMRGESESEKPERYGFIRRPKTDWIGNAWAVASVAAATLIGWPLYHMTGLSNANVLMIYLLAVLWVATHHSKQAAVLASVLGVLAFDFCFVPPYYTFTVEDRQYVITFAIMLVAALVISTLTNQVRAQGEAARDRERRTAASLALSRQLAAVRTKQEIADATVRQVQDVVGSRAMVLVPDDQKHLISAADTDPRVSLDEKELTVAQWVYEHDEPAGKGTDTLPASIGTYLPMKTSRNTVGVLGVVLNEDGSQWSAEQRQLTEAFASQAAIALERAALAEETRQAWERVEAEFLRNTLLSGVSHELRTPLAAITGAVTTVIEHGSSISPEVQREMLDTILGESEHMDRLINNLLDMTRLESGGLVLKKEWNTLGEIVGAVLHRLDRRLQGRQVVIRIPPDLPMVQLDATAIDQVLTNLLDNAIEYTPKDTPIEISASVYDDKVFVEVADKGPGLPAGAERRVFDKFFRAHRNQGGRGVGLGLAICRSIIELHGGEITASNRPGGGALFRFSLPRTEPPPIISEDESHG